MKGLKQKELPEKSENKQSKVNQRNINEIVKFEIINKGGNYKRDYKLTNNVKFEHFKDYFVSELKSCDLLHVIDENHKNDEINKKLLSEQKFKVRDILINHLDSNYHAKVMQFQDPKQILSKLAEIKRCEVNINSHTVRKQLYNMKYIFGKTFGYAG